MRDMEKEWGLTDILSFVVMESLEINEAFTCDQHFKQYGYRILL
jgi:predicted nucleic acid-binding protein